MPEIANNFKIELSNLPIEGQKKKKSNTKKKLAHFWLCSF
jgi:hypothetical protein